MIKKDEWVRIHKIILRADERTARIPEDTKKVPFEMWTKGFLIENAEIGDEVVIESVTGRRETGTLVGHNPHYKHDFGKFIPELLTIDKQVRDIVFGGDASE